MPTPLSSDDVTDLLACQQIATTQPWRRSWIRLLRRILACYGQSDGVDVEIWHKNNVPHQRILSRHLLLGHVVHQPTRHVSSGYAAPYQSDHDRDTSSTHFDELAAHATRSIVLVPQPPPDPATCAAGWRAMGRLLRRHRLPQPSHRTARRMPSPRQAGSMFSVRKPHPALPHGAL